MENTVLLVVDVQSALVSSNPYNKSEFLANISTLISTARQKGMELVFVRHDSGTGTELEYGTDGWQIVSDIVPASGEQIFNKKFSSSFRDTGLREYLDGRGVKSIILCGMQTDFCIDTTCRVAFEFGYRVIIPRGATTTFDNHLAKAENIVRYFENELWVGGRFAEVKPLEEVLCMIKN